MKTKAYTVNLNRIENGWEYSEVVCYAKDKNEARAILLKKIRFDEYRLKYTKREVDYLNIPVIRVKDRDLVFYEGVYITKSQLDHINLIKKRKDEYKLILDDQSITHCFIIKRGCYYRPNYCGYTERFYEAGVYEKQNAIKHAGDSLDITIKPIDNERHNRDIQRVIDMLNTKFITF